MEIEFTHKKVDYRVTYDLGEIAHIWQLCKDRKGNEVEVDVLPIYLDLNHLFLGELDEVAGKHYEEIQEECH